MIIDSIPYYLRFSLIWHRKILARKFMFSRFSGGRANPIPQVRPSGLAVNIFGKGSVDEALTYDMMIGPTDSKEPPKNDYMVGLR